MRPSPRALAGALGPTALVSFVMALVLFALVAVLGVASLGFVKRHMSGRTWKRVQRLAYPFFVFVWLHLVFMLAPAATGGQAVLSVALYMALFASYVALRLFRWCRDRKIEPSVGTVERKPPSDKELLMTEPGDSRLGGPLADAAPALKRAMRKFAIAAGVIAVIVVTAGVGF